MTVAQTIESLIGAWRSGDAHLAAAYFTDDAVYQEARHEPVSGRAAIVSHFTRFFRDGPLWRFDVEDIIVEGGRAALSYCFAIKGEGEGWNERAGCAVIHFRGGLIELWREYDG